MKKLLCLFAALAASVSAFAQTSPIHFRSILQLDGTRHFSLATEGGAKTAWVEVGDFFDGYEVTAFEPEGSVLVLQGEEGEQLRLTLAQSTVAEEQAEPAFDEAAELLRSMKFEEMMATSIEQQKEMMEKMFRQIAQQSGQSVDEEALARQMRFMEAFHDAMDWEGMQEGMIQAYGETFTTEELQGLLDFYSTPAGQGYVNKQAELVERTTKLIQPRISEAMRQLQPMIREMQQEERHRAEANAAGESAPAEQSAPTPAP